ncbi:MAG: tetratricopeptide repeat protein [Candidatus Tectomicrobia bacterium]|uniref:Tetratricopeptide repeat protein n=1 Tax=Tectimicrobiota bacterium TaxID=2528274 RepID=A0A932CPF1_UNCTE|nr:tetratricopeptide repeat protein [Candidatus Tectomicrobia bacterium]
MKNFFISYNSADRSWAEWIAWQLEEEGYTTVLQAWDFRPGANFVLEMQQAAEEAERTIAVLSPDYLAALYTQPEWAAAFVQDPTGKKGTLLPVRVRECEPKGLLRSMVYIDLVGQQDEATARDVLLRGIHRERAKPTVPPTFPGTAPRSVAERPRFPGALPSIWNVPHHRNPNFTGRETLLADLRTALISGEPAALIQAISGLGGVGKTQLAVEYAYRHTADYVLVWWVRAEEPATRAADYAGLARELDLPQKDAMDQRVVTEAVRRWLGQNPGWLLVFDNAPDPKDLRPYLPQGCAGHLLVTSRNPNWRGIAKPLPVKFLTQAEAVEFLLKRTGQIDAAAAAALAKALGYLPLALEQAGAYMEATGRSLSDYLEIFREHSQELLGPDYPPATDYPDTVATTWEISFQQVQRESPAGADLLNLCAFLAPEDIPRNVLREGAQHLPESLSAAVADSLAFDKMIQALRRYSLVEATGDALSVHRLVHTVARNRMAEDARRTWAEAAVQLVNGAFTFDRNDVRTWPTSSHLLSHALATAGHAEILRLASEATGELLNNTGLYLRERAESTEAKAALERALTIGEATYGPNHPTVAIRFNNLGDTLRALGNLAEARTHFERALAINEAAYGPNHPETATAICNLGNIFRDIEDFEGARGHYERALAIDEAAYGPNHPAVATDVNNLGLVLQDLGDLKGARAHFERALAIDEAVYGPSHPNIATYVNNLGSVLQNLGDLEGARTHYERALAINEAAYGPNYPYVASIVNNLGSVFRALGDLGRARVHYERALQIFRELLGADHPSTLTVRSNLDSLGA